MLVIASSASGDGGRCGGRSGGADWARSGGGDGGGGVGSLGTLCNLDVNICQ